MHLENFYFFHWPLRLDERSEHKAFEHSEVIVAFAFAAFALALSLLKLPQASRLVRLAIEYERSKYIGQFSCPAFDSDWAFNYF